jgi:hypothetical protein
MVAAESSLVVMGTHARSHRPTLILTASKVRAIVAAVMALVLALSLFAVVEQKEKEAEAADLSWSTLITPSMEVPNEEVAPHHSCQGS